MKVLLISPNKERIPYYIYPIGLDYVAGSIAEKHQVEIIDMNVVDRENLEKKIRDFSPDVTGISMRNIDSVDIIFLKSFIEPFRDIVNIVRNNSDSILILGGSGFTIYPAALMKELNADFGIVGEGERLSQLLEAIEQEGDTSDIPGVVTQDSSEDDAAIPPPWNGPLKRHFSDSYSHAGFYIERGGMLNLQTKRGCPYSCIYCTYPHIEGHKLRYMDPGDVAQTALQLQEAGAQYLFITDSVFNSDYDHSLRIAEEFKKNNLSIPWGAFMAPSKAPDGYYKILADAGMKHIEFGTESLSAKMLKSYKKPFSIDDVFTAHEQGTGAGIHAAHYLLLGGPGEDMETIRETLVNADTLPKTAVFFFCGMRISPNTEIHSIAVREGQVSADDPLIKPVFYHPATISNDEITEIIKREAKGRSNWIVGSGGSVIARLISRMHRQGHTGPLWEFIIQ